MREEVKVVQKKVGMPFSEVALVDMLHVECMAAHFACCLCEAVYTAQ